MTAQTLREVNAPYTVNPDDEAIGRETIIIRRNGEPVAAVVPYAEYQQWLAVKQSPSRPSIISALPISPDFLRQWEAFQRLRPELLKKYAGQWVAIVNEQVADVGPDFSTVARRTYAKLGNVPMCISEVLEEPRVYRMTARKVVGRVD
jgi:antitoxin (DNA-binding transcriptional repressor) of toxin-antitoxin stability system